MINIDTSTREGRLLYVAVTKLINHETYRIDFPPAPDGPAVIAILVDIAAQMDALGIMPKNNQHDRLCDPPSVIDYQFAKDAEEDRWLREHPLYHSPYNPRLTHSMDKARYDRLREHLKQWAINWMQERGFRVVLAEDGSDYFDVVPI